LFKGVKCEDGKFTVDKSGKFTVSYRYMDFRDNLITAFNRYCEITGLQPATVSTKVTNDGKFYESILNGAGCTMKRYEHIMEWFKVNTPKTKSTKKRSN